MGHVVCQPGNNASVLDRDKWWCHPPHPKPQQLSFISLHKQSCPQTLGGRVRARGIEGLVQCSFLLITDMYLGVRKERKLCSKSSQDKLWASHVTLWPSLRNAHGSVAQLDGCSTRIPPAANTIRQKINELTECFFSSLHWLNKAYLKRQEVEECFPKMTRRAVGRKSTTQA